MTGKGTRLRVVLRYAAFQAPGIIVFMILVLLVREWLYDFPLWVFWALTAAWVIKDALLFPFFRHAYETENGSSVMSMKGLTGTARNRLSPKGYVEVRGELWRAEVPAGKPYVEKGERITVTGKKGITLIVENDRAQDEKRYR